MSTILLFLIVIVFLVVAHELGHFLVAKAFGVRVDEFGIGYPPRARKLFKWKGTQFTLNWLPFGGFVKIFGEDTGAEPSDRSVSFAYKPLGQRLLVIAAGIIANMLIAVLLYSASFGIGFLASPDDFKGSVPIGPKMIIVTDVLADSPASGAGITSGDTIARVAAGADAVVPSQVTEVVEFIRAHGSEEVTLSLTHAGETKNVVLVPKSAAPETPPSVGIALAEVARVRLPFFKALAQGTVYTGHQFMLTLSTLGALVGGLFRGSGDLISQVSGPVGIARIAGQAYSLGIGSLLSFVALISVNLAVINLLPFPALDGGRMVLELFASKGKSRIPKRVVNGVNSLGFLLLILLMVYVTYQDVRRLFA